MKIISTLISKIKDSQIAKDSTWAVIGSAVSKCADMIVGIIIARLLGVDAFGEYGMVKSTLFYIAVFSTFGLGSTANRYMALCNTDDYHTTVSIVRNSITITLITSVVMAILLFTCAGVISDEPHLVAILRYTALIVIFNAINTTQLGLLSGLKQFKTIAVINTISGFATLILGIGLTYYFKLIGAVGALFATTLIQCILNQIAIKRHLSRARKNCTTESDERGVTISQLFKFSLPIAMQECVYASASWIRVMMITSLAGYDELGLYTATNQCHLIIIFIPGVLRNVIRHVDGILADLGVSSHQFDSGERGFSFRFDAPLDMRMNQLAKKNAADIINGYEQDELARIFKIYGEIDKPRKAAELVCSARSRKPIETTGELSKAVAKMYNTNTEHKFLAKLYQALRIEVNMEMQALEEFLK